MELKHKETILRLLAEHRIMTVATVRPDGWPQATTVGYASEGLMLYFLCGRQSQKAAYIAVARPLSAISGHRRAVLTGTSLLTRRFSPGQAPASPYTVRQTQRAARRISSQIP